MQVFIALCRYTLAAGMVPDPAGIAGNPFLRPVVHIFQGKVTPKSPKSLERNTISLADKAKLEAKIIMT